MAMARVLCLDVVLCLMQCAALITGTVITFQSAPQYVKQGLTKTLTLNCSLSDNNNTDTTSSGSVIGKRDVTHTTDNVALLTSMVITKNGHDVASVSSAHAAHVMDGSANLQVSGSVAGNSGRTGFLYLTFTDPSQEQTGEFVCEAHTQLSGKPVIFSSSVEMESSQPTMADLVAAVRELSTKNGDLDKKNSNLENTVANLKTMVENTDQKNANLENVVNTLQHTNQALEQTVSELKNRSDTMVYFNARITYNGHYVSGQDVAFNDILHNLGNGYSAATARFTCNVPGYYFFSLGCLTMPNERFSLSLKHNGNNVFNIYGSASSLFEAAANTATLQLAVGDYVNVQATGYVSAVSGKFCSFSGHLIKAL